MPAVVPPGRIRNGVRYSRHYRVWLISEVAPRLFAWGKGNLFVSGGDAVGEVSHAGEEVNAKPRSGGWQGLIRPFRAVVHGGAVPRPLAWAGAEARRWRWQTWVAAALAATPLGLMRLVG